MPEERDIDDRDEDATDAPAIVRRLNKVLTIQKKVTARLTRIEPNVPDPGPPDLPALLQSITAEIEASLAIARRIGTRNG